MRKGAVSDVGRVRSLNEDSFHLYGGLRYGYGLVADGMGGHKAGEIASSMAIESIKKTISSGMKGYGKHKSDDIKAMLCEAVVKANKEIYDYAKADFAMLGMGTTVSLALIYDQKMYIAHVGDSRVYRIKDNKIEQMTTDHSYVNELVSMGQITKEQAKSHPKKNVITRAVGTEPSIRVDVSEYTYKGETILICSDGLTNLVGDSEIASITSGAKSLNDAAKKLVTLANERGGSDNITVIIFDERQDNKA